MFPTKAPGAINITIFMTPRPAKAEEFLEIFSKNAKEALENEPGVLIFELQKGTKDPHGDGPVTFVVREKYADQAAYDHHMKVAKVPELVQKLADEGFYESIDIRFTEDETYGFSRF
ncbi:hypothetical protein E8E14_002697 [Neopestalotiopsis sp. 37M]|nr:hypothetical protein E8E14_002697 [Neopestalotiopsis sp. 37M]